MNNLIRVITILLVFAWHVLSGPSVRAQGYGATQMKSIQANNSISRYSVSAVNSQVLNSGVPTAGVAGINQRTYAGARASQNFAAPRQPLIGNSGLATANPKPFSQINRGPTVSPYLALNNPFSTAEDYYNVVKPLQEQRRTNEALSRQQYTQARKLNQLAAEGPFELTGSEGYAPTGHASGFMKMGSYLNTGSYFAPPTQPKQNR